MFELDNFLSLSYEIKRENKKKDYIHFLKSTLQDFCKFSDNIMIDDINSDLFIIKGNKKIAIFLSSITEINIENNIYCVNFSLEDSIFELINRILLILNKRVKREKVERSSFIEILETYKNDFIIFTNNNNDLLTIKEIIIHFNKWRENNCIININKKHIVSYFIEQFGILNKENNWKGYKLNLSISEEDFE